MSDILEMAEDMANDLCEVGVMDEITLRKIKALCLPPQRTFQAADIQRIRKANHVSQAVFAAILGIGKTTVQQWERGLKKPSGPARRLLDLLDRKGLEALL